jgi:23S rRNA pseudouridine2605 synthase
MKESRDPSPRKKFKITRRPPSEVPGAKNDQVRLNKFIAATGICSRREADQYILAGKIKVNGNVITEMGARINPTDIVLLNGKPIKTKNNVYILLNKPKDTSSFADGNGGKRNAFTLVKKATQESIFSIEPLDERTTGVLLLTNDKVLGDKLTELTKKKLTIYHAFLNKELSSEHYNQLLDGVKLDEETVKVVTLSHTDDEDKKQVGIEIRTGSDNIVHRIFEQLGYKLVKLDRVYFAGLSKKGLQRGHWRHLKTTEVANLKMGGFQ